MRTSSNKTSNKKPNRKPSGKSNYRSKRFPDTKGNKNQRRMEESIDAEEKAYSKTNAFKWYNAFPSFAKDVSNLAFGTPVGQPIYVGNDATANAGIMVLEYYPTPGNSVDLQSPLNRQAVRFYSYLRSMLRSANAYDSADLMMYMMQVDSLYSYWAFMQRAYRVAQLFTPVNKYYPRNLLQSMGFDPSIVNNLADFRAYINNFALNVGRYSMPAEFDINERHMWMCSGLYLDSNTTRAQTYVFVPAGFYQFDNTVTTGSQLKLVAWGDLSATSPTLHTLDDIITFGNSLLNNFNNDEDTMNISGDLYRAYNGKLRELSETRDGEAILPVYDEVVLSQIENSIAVGSVMNGQTSTAGSVPVISQNPTVNNGSIIFDPYFLGGQIDYQGGRLYNFPLMYASSILNCHMDSPNPEAVMEMTRLVPVTEQNVQIAASNTQLNLGMQSFGADLISQYRICITNPDNYPAIRFITARTNTVYVSNGVLQSSSQLEWVALCQQFDWAPLIYIVEVTPVAGGIPTLNFKWFANDVDNMTAVSARQMYNIHEAAMLSLLEAPVPDKAGLN